MLLHGNRSGVIGRQSLLMIDHVSIHIGQISLLFVGHLLLLLLLDHLLLLVGKREESGVLAGTTTAAATATKQQLRLIVQALEQLLLLLIIRVDGHIGGAGDNYDLVDITGAVSGLARRRLWCLSGVWLIELVDEA